MMRLPNHPLLRRGRAIHAARRAPRSAVTNPRGSGRRCGAAVRFPVLRSALHIRGSMKDGPCYVHFYAARMKKLNPFVVHIPIPRRLLVLVILKGRHRLLDVA